MPPKATQLEKDMLKRLQARFGQPGVNKDTIAGLLRDFAGEYFARKLPGMRRADGS